MSITKAQTNKLLTNLNGKQAFIIVTQNTIERILQQAATFSDAEIKNMMQAIWNNPHHAHEYKEWQQAWFVMSTAMYEGRLAIMEAITIIQMQLMITSHVIYDSHMRQDDKLLQWANEHISLLNKQHQRIIHWLEWVQRWRIILHAFDVLLATRMNETIKHDNERLEVFIGMYHDRMSWLQSDIDFANIKAMQAKVDNAKGKDKSENQQAIDKMMTELDAQPDKWQLPPLAITADNPTLQSCISYLNHCPEKPFYGVIELVEWSGA